MSSRKIDISPTSLSDSTSLEVPILSATIPSRNNRYNENLRPHAHVGKSLLVIPAQVRAQPLSEVKPGLVDNWREWQHPEGETYLVRGSTGVVTSANVQDEHVRHLLDGTAHSIRQKLLRLAGIKAYLIEIYLNPIFDRSDRATVEYYLVDHETRTIFWLDGVACESVGIPKVCSPDYLKSFWIKEYWTHVDHFPMHLDPALMEPAETELMWMLAHGRLDGMTSPGSTCPYSVEECSQYLTILETARGANNSADMGDRTACVARLWGNLENARHINSYGLKRPRLDRLQGFSGLMDGVGVTTSTAALHSSESSPSYSLGLSTNSSLVVASDLPTVRRAVGSLRQARLSSYESIRPAERPSSPLVPPNTIQHVDDAPSACRQRSHGVVPLRSLVSDVSSSGRPSPESQPPARTSYVPNLGEGLDTPPLSYRIGQTRALDLEAGLPPIQPGDILLEAIHAAGLGRNAPYPRGSTPAAATARSRRLSFKAIVTVLTLLATILGVIWVSYSTFHPQSSSQ